MVVIASLFLSGYHEFPSSDGSDWNWGTNTETGCFSNVHMGNILRQTLSNVDQNHISVQRAPIRCCSVIPLTQISAQHVAVRCTLVSFLSVFAVVNSELKSMYFGRHCYAFSVLCVSLAGLVQRCVIIQKDKNGFGLTVSGDNPVFVQLVKEGKAARQTWRRRRRRRKRCSHHANFWFKRR